MNTRSPIRLDRLELFAAVAQAGGFTAAARLLGSTKTLVSQQVGRLEEELGGPLFHRTTRRVTLTAAGQQLYQECAPLLREIGAAVERFGVSTSKLSGPFRITVPPEYAADVLGPILAEFIAQHPDLEVEVIATSQVLDLVADRVDVAIRAGALKDSSLRSAPLGTFESWVVASPDHVRRHGTPRRPEELADHPWVGLTLLRTPYAWRFSAKGRRDRVVRMKPVVRASAPQAVVGLVRGGVGITALADFTVSADIESGRLVRLLPDWTLPRGGIYALYPGGREAPAKVRAFIDFLRAKLER